MAVTATTIDHPSDEATRRGARRIMLGRARRARGGGQGMALALMLAQQVQRLDRKPPVTLALMAFMYYLHFQHGRHEALFKPYYLCPDRVVVDWQLSRVVASAFLHVDDLHLYHNMLSFLWKGYHLEGKYGGPKFAAVIVCLLLLSHTLVVAAAVALAALFHDPTHLHQCSIGFSGVLFALKVVLNHNAPSTTSVYGFQVPTKYAAWLELVMIHVLVPRASFLGHMCGILAGYMFVYSPSLQQSLSSVTRWVETLARKLLVNPADANARRSPRPSTASRGPASSTRAETDEELARRLQEEEFQAEEARQRAREPHLSASELRHRRLARFGQY